ncbi:MAG: ABC transporter permease, partial [Campylobacteraceae bacterium]|nr:ABC transporter permease [Campylobacteraceae bacterium]
AASRDDAEITKGRSEVSSIRSSIVLKRSQDLMSGGGANPAALDSAASDTPGALLFDEVLDYGIPAGASSGKWRKTGTNEYSFNLSGTWVAFDYNATTGRFNCTDPSSQGCLDLTR